VSSGPLVLVGTDGSYTSFKAVEKAAAMAAEKSGSLLIISAYVESHTHSPSAAEDEMGDLAYQMRGSNPAEAAVQEAKDKALAAVEVEIDTEVGEGEPLDVLGRIAKERSADYVVVGNVGRRGLAGRITGSVPEGIKRHVPDAEVVIVNTNDDTSSGS
jgi:nucleotide-binding universal stress UspA family protein